MDYLFLKKTAEIPPKASLSELRLDCLSLDNRNQRFKATRPFPWTIF